jgi:hypothetical protein
MPSTPRLTAEHLSTIRQHTDWRQLFTALGIQKDPQKSNDHDWWGKSPFHPEERTASFHINDKGWYCHSTGQGGGAIELVQRLRDLDCYKAGRWLLEHGVSQLVEDVREEIRHVEEVARPPGPVEPRENAPIRQDLRPHLQADHPAFADRGIPPDILQALGAGYLERPPRKNGKPDFMHRRLVFQVRGLCRGEEGGFSPAILGHIGRATSPEQEEQDGKWWTYSGFRKSLELYNIDLAVLEDTALEQARQTGHILVVEGCFDVAKLRAAGIHNVVATFGSSLSDRQTEELAFLAHQTGVHRFLFWYDRDPAGEQGVARATEMVAESDHDLEIRFFDWQQTWQSSSRGTVALPDALTDPCDFSVEQLQWLRARGHI